MNHICCSLAFIPEPELDPHLSESLQGITAEVWLRLKIIPTPFENPGHQNFMILRASTQRIHNNISPTWCYAKRHYLLVYLNFHLNSTMLHIHLGLEISGIYLTFLTLARKANHLSIENQDPDHHQNPINSSVIPGLSVH